MGRVVSFLFGSLYDFRWKDYRMDYRVVLRWGYGIDVVVCGVNEFDNIFMFYLIINFYFKDEFVVIVIY